MLPTWLWFPGDQGSWSAMFLLRCHTSAHGKGNTSAGRSDTAGNRHALQQAGHPRFNTRSPRPALPLRARSSSGCATRIKKGPRARPTSGMCTIREISRQMPGSHSTDQAVGRARMERRRITVSVGPLPHLRQDTQPGCQ